MTRRMRPTVNTLFPKCVMLLAMFILPLFCTGHAQSNSRYARQARSIDRYHFHAFDVRGSRYFSNYKSIVGRYLRQASPHRRARACVVGQRVEGQRNDTAYVVWRGGDKLILWGAAGDSPDSYETLINSNRSLSIRHDVVATDEAVGSSTYLVSRRWVAELERECARYGRYVTVN